MQMTANWFITPAIKAKLRRKNRLMRRGKIEEASALADRIRKDILHRSRSRLIKLEGKADVRDVWAAVRQLFFMHVRSSRYVRQP